MSAATVGSPGIMPGISRPRRRPARGGHPLVRSATVLLLASSGCQTNTCQDLCQSYYELALRCELFALYDSMETSACIRDEDDPQTLRQQADYAASQCQQDFLRVEPESSLSRSCCVRSCFSSLATRFDALEGTDEASVEQKRDVCLQFQSLVQAGDAAWCQRDVDRVSCELSWDEANHATIAPAAGTSASASTLWDRLRRLRLSQ